MKKFGVLSIWMLALLALAGCGKSSLNFPPDDTRVRLDSTNLPIVWIEVGGDSIVRGTRIAGSMKIIYNGEGRLNYADTLAHQGQHVDYAGPIAIRYRGNSTYNESPKKAYSLRTLAEPLRHGSAKKQKVSLLGMGKDNNWALLAPYADKSLMRELITRQLTTPWMEFTPQGRLCEVILDGTYYGVYILSEVVSKGKQRLNLHSPGDEGDALTGDYLLEVDHKDEQYYVSKHRPLTSDGQEIEDRDILIHYKSPDLDKLSDEQLQYINGRVDAMEASFEQGDFRRYIDVASFIDYQLMTELCHNADGYRLSGKFYKRRDSVDPRFKMVLWDTDLAYGNCKYNQGWRTDTWIYCNNDSMYQKGEKRLIPCWWYWLNRDDAYTAQFKQRWAQLRATHLSNAKIMATIDSLSLMLTAHGAEQRNTQAWPRWGVPVWPNYYLASNHADEVAYIKRWLTERLAWMDERLLDAQ